jgi:LAO/AO transport system kinase
VNRLDRVRAGQTGAIARMISRVERGSDGVAEELAELHRAGGHAHVIGITGAAGSGKSTLVSALTAHYRRTGRTVGILAVDPSSVFSGGAILGDRIRMSELSGDDGVFIRSIATRGALGGLSRAALDAITVLDAAGKDVIILETVGVGQAEVDVISAAQSVAVVSVPGMGDDVQAIKAGLLEIADVHVINKADRDGARKAYAEIRDMLRMSTRSEGSWEVPIVQTVASAGTGVAELAEKFDEHHAWMTASGELDRRAKHTAAMRIRWMAEQIVLDRLRAGQPDFDHEVQRVAELSTDPLHAARRLLSEPLNVMGAR